MMAFCAISIGFASCSDDDDDDDDPVTVKYVGTSGAYFELSGTNVYSSGTWDLKKADGTSMHSAYLSDCKYTVSSTTSDVEINGDTKNVYTVTFTYTTISSGEAGNETHYLSSDKSVLYYYNSRSGKYTEYTKQ